MPKPVSSVIAIGLAAVTGCSLGSPSQTAREPANDAKRELAAPGGPRSGPKDAILYTIGLSTDPYGSSSPAGFGVVTAIGTKREQRIEVRRRGLGSFGGADWIGSGRVVVPQGAPPLRPPLLYRFDGSRLAGEGPANLLAREPGADWSPDGRRVATQQVVACAPRQRTLFECYRLGKRIHVQDADGSNRRLVARGEHAGWTADGRLLVRDRRTYRALDVDSATSTVPLAEGRVRRLARVPVWLGPPRWSADGRYLAAHVAARWPAKARTTTAVVIADAEGRPLRLLRSRYIISMFSWSPTGHRLAYTTSGFPDPHELFVVDEPEAEPARLLATDRHFDWVTWSPDGQRLLVDDENRDAWRLLAPDGARRVRKLPRLGGRPVWCCPANSFATSMG